MMEIVEETEKSSGVGDSAYSYSCSNSKSTQSSKSTSESNSSGSSGYRGKRADADYNIKNNNALPNLEKRVNDETKAVDIKLENASVGNYHDAQPMEFIVTPQSSNEEVKDGIDNVYLSSPAVTVGEVGKESDSMDISSSDQISCQNNELVFCVKTKDHFQSTVCDPYASLICNIDCPNMYCSDGFFCVLSMVDGIVMYTTLSISSILGFPQDMWIGRSFIDFIHPNDRDLFVSQVSNDCTLWKDVNASDVENHSSTMFCRIRRHRILTSGYGVSSLMSAFRPLYLKFYFKNIIAEDIIYLVIQAMSFSSAFKISNEKITDPVPFVIKHSVDGLIKYIDRESVSYLGYLPQDILEKDIFEFYHPADLAYLLEVYESLAKQGSYVRCKPYRMLAQNGNYLKIETEWMSYINPWSGKLEYVIGKHYVVEGPQNPNVLDMPEKPKVDTPKEEEKAGIEQLTNSMKKLLNEVLAKPVNLSKQEVAKKCQVITAYMESFIRKANLANCMALKYNKYRNDSVKIGDMSCSDSKSSSDSCISYDRLNYDETLQRYFNSHESCIVNGYSSEHLFKAKGFTPERLASTNAYVSPTPSDQTTASTSSSPDLTAQNETVWLTESLLNKHNEKMEKKLVKTHYKNKSLNLKGKTKDNKVTKQKMNEHLKRCNEAYQPTTEDHLAHMYSRKRPIDIMGCSIPYKTRCMAAGDDYTTHMGMMTYHSTVLSKTYNRELCGLPHTYSSINQLPYSLEQNCLSSTIGKSSCSNGESIETNPADKKVKVTNSEETVYTENNTDEDFSFSSLYSSFFKTESKSAEGTESKPNNGGKFWQRRLLMDDVSSNASCEPLRSHNVTKRKMDPPWMDKVCVTPELIYKYQILNKSMEEVLSADRKRLAKLAQPALVNEQLGQLYMDLQLEGVAARLTLEEEVTSSSSSEENSADCPKDNSSHHLGYAKLAIVYEEDAPLPPPEDTPTSEET